MSPSIASCTSVQLSLLGDFSLSCGGERVELRRPAQRLLAYLALQRTRPVRRATVAERLWQHSDAHRASSSLRSALCRLPRPTGRPLVVPTATHVRLAADVGVDLWRSEDCARSLTRAPQDARLLDEPQPAGQPDLHETLTRDLLPDWYDDWLLVEQESYRQLRLHALETLSLTLRQADRHPEALLAGLAAVRSEPLRETAHRRVIEVHLAEGNCAEALRQYQLYRRVIAQELGLPPSAAIRRLVAPLLGRPVELERQR